MLTADAGLAAAAEIKPPEERTEEEKMALRGRPQLGEIFRAQIRIKESKEFKNTVDKLVQRANASIILGKLDRIFYDLLVQKTYLFHIKISVFFFFLFRITIKRYIPSHYKMRIPYVSIKINQ